MRVDLAKLSDQALYLTCGGAAGYTTSVTLHRMVYLLMRHRSNRGQPHRVVLTWWNELCSIRKRPLSHRSSHVSLWCAD